MTTTAPAGTLLAWQGKRLADMSRAELVSALNSLWQSYNAVNRKNLSGARLDPMPAADVAGLEDRLAQWFTPKE